MTLIFYVLNGTRTQSVVLYDMFLTILKYALSNCYQ